VKSRRSSTKNCCANWATDEVTSDSNHSRAYNTCADPVHSIGTRPRELGGRSDAGTSGVCSTFPAGADIPTESHHHKRGECPIRQPSIQLQSPVPRNPLSSCAFPAAVAHLRTARLACGPQGHSRTALSQDGLIAHCAAQSPRHSANEQAGYTTIPYPRPRASHPCLAYPEVSCHQLDKPDHQRYTQPRLVRTDYSELTRGYNGQ
jgi:hypothetical protein